MASTQPGIALNVSRARLTILGFMLTVNVFAIQILLTYAGGFVSEKLVVNLPILTSLFASIGAGAIAVVLFSHLRAL